MPWRCEAASGQTVLYKRLHNTRAWRVEVTPEDSKGALLLLEKLGRGGAAVAGDEEHVDGHVQILADALDGPVGEEVVDHARVASPRAMPAWAPSARGRYITEK